jgi:hypothetical protein
MLGKGFQPPTTTRAYQLSVIVTMLVTRTVVDDENMSLVLSACLLLQLNQSVGRRRDHIGDENLNEY